MYTYILFPGRHHALTNFQFSYINAIAQHMKASTIEGEEVPMAQDFQVVWAITSGNHANTRRNPVSGPRRLAMIEYASQALQPQSQVYAIPNMSQKSDFAHYLIEEIRLQSRGQCEMTPQNTLIACSTPAVLRQYQALGYKILPVELESLETEHFVAPRPWDAVEKIIAVGAKWQVSQEITDILQPACKTYYVRYGLAEHIIETFSDPLTSDDGDITVSREYETYRAAFEENAFRKVAEFAPFVRPGRIMDVGCATGQTIKLLSELPELFESDFYGIEAARPLYDICEQRRHNGNFGNANVFFYQRNIMRSTIFPPGTLDTIITMALTHEIESYIGRESLLQFIARMYDMLAPGGVYINYDVAGPTNKDEIVWALLTETDGENPVELYPEGRADDPAFLQSLSSKAKFLRFCKDFRQEEGDTIRVEWQEIEGKTYAVLRYADLCDYLAKRDYTDSWRSEMHERFCFWNYIDWVEALKAAGYEIHSASKPVQNKWLIEHRFAPAAKVYRSGTEGSLEELSHPDTNMLIVAQKPL